MLFYKKCFFDIFVRRFIIACSNMIFNDFTHFGHLKKSSFAKAVQLTFGVFLLERFFGVKAISL